jgi:hypothetical protein
MELHERSAGPMAKNVGAQALANSTISECSQTVGVVEGRHTK